MNYHELRQAADRVRAIPLEDVLTLIGAERDRYDRAKWHTDRAILSVTGPKFFNWNQGVGGGGAIDLVIYLEGVGFKAAVEWLARHFPDSAPSRRTDPTDRPPPQPPNARQLELPPRDDKRLSIVTTYLVRERRLAPALIEPLVETGEIYADDRGNAVFLLLGDNAHPVGAEIRGTTSRPFRGMAPGSRKDLGYFSVSATEPMAIVLCESAIDALSCFTLHPETLCISTAGARSNPRWLDPLLCRAAQAGQVVWCGFDADPTGDCMARAMSAVHPRHVYRLRPKRNDWNDVLTAQA